METKTPETDALMAKYKQPLGVLDLHEAANAFYTKAKELERDRANLRKAIETCVKDFEKTKWGWDGPCGTTDIISRLEDSLSNDQGDSQPPTKD
jgi:hypothetical protein